MMLFGCSFRLLKWIIIIAIFVLLVNFWLHNKTHLMQEKDIAAIAKKYAGPDYKQAFDKIHQELRKKYPGYILPKEDMQWIFMNAGGHMGVGCMLFGSLTEYLLFYGSPVDTSGHSGRFWANITISVLSGEYTEWEEGTLNTHVYGPGDTTKLQMGSSRGVAWKAQTWTVEYARGFIPSTVIFNFGDALFSAQDFVTIYHLFKFSAKAMMLYYTTAFSEMIA